MSIIKFTKTIKEIKRSQEQAADNRLREMMDQIRGTSAPPTFSNSTNSMAQDILQMIRDRRPKRDLE